MSPTGTFGFWIFQQQPADLLTACLVTDIHCFRVNTRSTRIDRKRTRCSCDMLKS